MSIRILLADDHAMFRQGLRMLLEREQDMNVVEEAADGQSAVERVLELMPDVAVLDISMPGMDGLKAARMIHESTDQVGIVILTMHRDRHYLIEALKFGVKSFILKEWAPEELVTAVRSVHNKVPYLSPRLSDVIISGFAGQDHVPSEVTLTPRELQAYHMLVNGKNCKEIAFELQISSKTVETYRLKVMKKLNVSNIAQLMKYAIQEGIVVRT